MQIKTEMPPYFTLTNMLWLKRQTISNADGNGDTGPRPSFVDAAGWVWLVISLKVSRLLLYRPAILLLSTSPRSENTCSHKGVCGKIPNSTTLRRQKGTDHLNGHQLVGEWAKILQNAIAINIQRKQRARPGQFYVDFIPARVIWGDYISVGKHIVYFLD